MSEFALEFVKKCFTNFVDEFKYEIRTNSRELVLIFARKIDYVTNGLYCNIHFTETNQKEFMQTFLNIYKFANLNS